MNSSSSGSAGSLAREAVCAEGAPPGPGAQEADSQNLAGGIQGLCGAGGEGPEFSLMSWAFAFQIS